MGKAIEISERQRIVDEFRDGKGVNAISAETGISRRSVGRVRDDALAAWREANIGSIDEMLSREMMKLDNIEEIVMRDYERSKRALRPMEYAALMARGMSMDEIDECFANREQCGDPRYLESLLKIGLQRMRVIGVVGRSDHRKQTINQYNFGNLSEEDMRRIVGEMQDSKYEEEQL